MSPDGTSRTAFPMLLAFKSKRTEELWHRSQSARLRLTDSAFFLLFCVPIGVQCRRVWQERTGSVRLVLPVCLASFFGFGVLCACSRDLHARYRNLIIMFIKVISVYSACVVVIIRQEPVDSWLHFVQFELVHYSRTAAMIFLGLLAPLRLQEHILVQSAAVVMSILYNPATCQAFYERLPSSCRRYQTVTAGLDYIFAPFLPTSHRKQEDEVSAAQCHALCIRTLAFIQVVFAFVLTTLLLFAWEQHSRLSFQARFLEQGAAPQAKLSRLQRCLFVAHLYGGLAFLWLCLRWCLSEKHAG